MAAHAEPTRSSAAEEYVWKEESAVPGTRFEVGSKSVRRDVPRDWEAIWDSAKRGDMESIPADVRIRCYGTLRKIREDYYVPTAIERDCVVYWGKTGTGKSRRAWEEAGDLAYPKDPRTKFWCGYSGQASVVIDEFRGNIDISHLLRWLDRYPVRVEIKGSAFPLSASKFWITSNIHPKQWYPDLDQETVDAMLRRMKVTQFH